MKNFLRSVAGKTVLFVLVAIMFAAAAVSAASVVFLTLNGFYDEKTDVESAGDRMRGDYFSRYVQQDAYSAAFAVLTAGEEPYTPDSLQYSLYDETGNLISTNHDASVPETGDFWDYRVYIWKNETFLRVSFYDDPTEIGEKYVFCASPSNLREGYFGVDRYSRTANLISLGYSVRYIMIAVLAVSASLLLAAFVTLMCVSGRRPNTEEIVPGVLNRVPFDLLASCSVFFCLSAFLFVADNFSYVRNIIAAVIFGLLGFCVLLGLSMSFSARIKEGTLIKTRSYTGSSD